MPTGAKTRLQKHGERLARAVIEEHRSKPERRQALVKARLSAGLTQKQLAERIGSHNVTIARIERGAMTPTVSVALAISHELGQSVEQLFGGDR